tara:strand:- start:424 stop:678 length:255 start_codon:yes stop_codon:yes gene_type:complete
MKSGTTSLYDHIATHPSVRRGRQKEFHFFDWRWDQVNEASTSIAASSTALALQVREALRIRNQDVADPLLQTFGQFFEPSMNDL